MQTTDVDYLNIKKKTKTKYKSNTIQLFFAYFLVLLADWLCFFLKF